MAKKKSFLTQLEPIAHLALLMAAFVVVIAALVLTASTTDTSPVFWPPISPPVSPHAGQAIAAFNPTVELTAQSFATANEFSAFARDYEDAYYDYRLMDGGVMPLINIPMADLAMGSAESQKPTDFSTTNVQVLGVDEADLIKTDGEYIYTISDDTVYIIQAYPGEEAKVISQIEYDYSPRDLFISDGKLAVFGTYRGSIEGIDFVPSSGMSFFDIYDITDRANPSLSKEYKFEGRYFNARMYEGYAYLVLVNGFEYRPFYPTPLIVEDGAVEPMAVADIYYFPIPYTYPDLVTVHSINMNSPTEVKSKAIAVEGDQNMYMSTDNIYITYTEYVNEYDLRNEIMVGLLEPQLSSADKKLITDIEAVSGEILSRREKDAKILAIYTKHLNYMTQDEQDDFEDKVELMVKEKLEEYEHFEFTIINQLGVDNGDISIGATGKVPGHVINQFSMDEHNEVFRIATTVSPRWSWRWQDGSDSVNNVYALDSSLEVIGELEDLAESERIYSTRFMGDRLYMVTFRQVDPFFVIDLSDPTDIKSLGELKIPGFSRYLHPYDDDTIIGIGQEATEQGRITGLKISLFDVSDVANPTEVAKFVTEEKYAKSTALTDHHAFLFSKEKELMVIPVYSGWDADQEYDGAFVFKINKDAIELRGLVDHSAAGGYGPSVERSLYIEELLYTKSPNLLRINAIEDLSSVKDISLGSTDFPVF
ncbi:beta-propeller domain-containing protein [archaeon]